MGGGGRCGGRAGKDGTGIGRGPGRWARGVVPAPVSSKMEVIILIVNAGGPLDVVGTRVGVLAEHFGVVRMAGVAKVARMARVAWVAWVAG